jgi:hypothetical protein
MRWIAACPLSGRIEERLCLDAQVNCPANATLPYNIEIKLSPATASVGHRTLAVA